MLNRLSFPRRTAPQRAAQLHDGGRRRGSIWTGPRAAQRFALADFAPIFLFRANDNMLFEAGFDVTLQNDTASEHVVTSAPYTHDAAADHCEHEFRPVGLSSERLRDAGGRGHVVAAGHLSTNGAPAGSTRYRMTRWRDDLLPGSGVGAQLRGAVPVGESGTVAHLCRLRGQRAVSGTAAATPLRWIGGNRLRNLDLSGNVGVNAVAIRHAPIPAAAAASAGFTRGNRITILNWVFRPDWQWAIREPSVVGAVVDAALHIGPYFEVKGEYINTWVETD